MFDIPENIINLFLMTQGYRSSSGNYAHCIVLIPWHVPLPHAYHHHSALSICRSLQWCCDQESVVLPRDPHRTLEVAEPNYGEVYAGLLTPDAGQDRETGSLPPAMT